MPERASPPPVLLTGVAGFIGFHVASALLSAGARVVGVDALTAYGGRKLKEDRLALLSGRPGFEFTELDLADAPRTAALFRELPGIRVIHLAAQPGVRYSLEHPEAFIQSNLVGFANVLEGCRHARAEHLVYASSSSVYGASTRLPYSTADNVDHPISLYAATKKSNELMAHSYAHLYRLPCTGLRLFTVYGPWGRTDMAPHLFTQAILEGRPIDVFHQGQAERDFTSVEDVVGGILRVLERPARPDPEWTGSAPTPGTSAAPYRVYNLGNHQPVRLLRFIEVLEQLLGKEARKRFLPAQPGDVPATWADVSALEADVGFKPSTPLEVGLARYVAWFREYFRV